MHSQIKIHLVRHGETEMSRQGLYYGWKDVPLSREGREQVRALSKRLDTAYDRVYASDLSRAVETARMLLRGEPRQVFALREISFGGWEGLHYRQAKLDKEAWEGFCAGGPPPGGESGRDFYARVAAGWEEIQKDFPANGTILVCAHQGSIRAILAHVLGLGETGVWRFTLEPGQYAQLTLTDGYGYLTGLGL